MSISPRNRHGNYFQFPLCLLTFGSSPFERLNGIIDYSTFVCGLKAWEELSAQERESRAVNYLSNRRISRRDSANQSILALLEGQTKVGVTCFNPSAAIMQAERLQTFVDGWEQRHGREPLVRLRKDLVFEARDGKGITPRLLFVLAAMLSVIGNKQRPVRITRQTIAFRSQGYRSKAVSDAEMANRADSAKPPTEWQIRADIDEVVTRKLISRVTVSRRQSYYSSRMSTKQLSNAVFDMKTSRLGKRADQFLTDLALTQNIQNSRAQAQGRPLPFPDALPMETPNNLPSLETLETLN